MLWGNQKGIASIDSCHLSSNFSTSHLANVFPSSNLCIYSFSRKSETTLSQQFVYTEQSKQAPVWIIRPITQAVKRWLKPPSPLPSWWWSWQWKSVRSAPTCPIFISMHHEKAVGLATDHTALNKWPICAFIDSDYYWVMPKHWLNECKLQWSMFHKRNNFIIRLILLKQNPHRGLISCDYWNEMDDGWYVVATNQV